MNYPTTPHGGYPDAAVKPDVIDADHVQHQMDWSTKTFGPAEHRGPLGPLDHLRKELEEVAAAPFDLEEWVDIIILAFDGAWRAGHKPQWIIDAVKAKQAKNEARTWPSWEGKDGTVAIEHVRADGEPAHTSLVHQDVLDSVTQKWLRAVRERDALQRRVDRHGACACGPEEPDEFCPQDGRPYAEVLEMMTRHHAEHQTEVATLATALDALREEVGMVLTSAQNRTHSLTESGSGVRLLALALQPALQKAREAGDRP